MKSILQKIQKGSERGQAIILIAFAIVGLVAIVGLMVDGGILLIEYARLKRGIDAASIAAASQFRKPLSGAAGVAMGADMENAGREFLRLNQSDANVTIWTCSYPGTSHDESLCAAATGGIARKLVRITATRHVDFGFMRVVGIRGTDITATAVGEAASIDMVLAIDTSTSMAYETTGDPNVSDAANPGTGSPGDDPEVCNAHLDDPTQRCEPMGKIKDVAINFVDQLFYPYDRVAIVASTSQEAGGSRNATLVPTGRSFSDNQDDAGVTNTEVQDAIRGLRSLQLPRCSGDLSYPGSCLYFSPHYIGQPCMPKTAGDGNPTQCGSSNFGGMLKLAGEQFAWARTDSFWVVIALIGGPANATDPVGVAFPNGFCPNQGGAGNPTWAWPSAPADLRLGFCRDRDPMPGTYVPATYNPDTFDWSTYDPSTQTRHYINPATGVPDTWYDADDYARDQADFIASPVSGQGATIFSICLGSYCRDYPSTDPASAEHLGQYMALEAGDDPTAIPPVVANHGLYFHAVDTTGLEGVFDTIAENIFTRISQ